MILFYCFSQYWPKILFGNLKYELNMVQIHWLLLNFFVIAEYIEIFFELNKFSIQPDNVQLEHLRNFITWINELGMSARTQARVISGIKSFYKFLLINKKIEYNPTSLLEAPKLGRKLPVVLSIEEIDKLLQRE